MSATAELSDIEHRKQLRRAVVASAIGTTIEWYDFFLYGIVTGLVFAKLYFPTSDAIAGTLQAYGVFFIGFVARPIGAAIFGHYGDRLGRKSALIATLLITGLATFAVALVPGYDRIGVWAPILLVVLRFVQGVGVGGEWSGSVLLSMEWAKTNTHRGFIASCPQLGAPCGLALANLAVLAFSRLSGDQFLVWGWRVPFLLSIVMVAIGLYIRLGIKETPVFAKVVADERIVAAPTMEVIRRHPKQILLSAFARMGEQAPGYIYIAYVFTYGTAVLSQSRDFLLLGVLTTAILGGLWVPIAGHLSDRIGRKKMYIIAAVVSAVFGFVYFGLLETRTPALIFLAIALSFVPVMNLYGPQAALIAESFTPRLRYSGAGLGYQLASIVAGGPAPFVATWLFAQYHTGYAIAGYILCCSVVSMIATSMLTDHTNQDIAEDVLFDAIEPGVRPTAG